MKTPTIMNMLDELNLPKIVLNKGTNMDTGCNRKHLNAES